MAHLPASPTNQRILAQCVPYLLKEAKGTDSERFKAI